MGLGAGGSIRQKIYRDPYGVETWEPQPQARICVHIVNSLQFERITGSQTACNAHRREVIQRIQTALVRSL